MSSPDGRIERINHAICAMTGYTEGGLLGTLLADLVHPDDRRAGDGAVIEASVGVSAIRDDDHGV
jgi:PAS domain S-box-containing protein